MIVMDCNMPLVHGIIGDILCRSTSRRGNEYFRLCILEDRMRWMGVR